MPTNPPEEEQARRKQNDGAQSQEKVVLAENCNLHREQQRRSQSEIGGWFTFLDEPCQGVERE